MPKLQMLKPRLATLDPYANIKMVDTTKKPWLKLSEIKTARWTKANNGRLLPLNHAAWRKLRLMVLTEEPLCRMCAAQGLTVVASQVDHINNDPSDNRRESLQSLCTSCHSHKTMRDMGHNVRMGSDTSGQPLDPYHHWNQGVRADLARADGALDEKSPATGAPIPSVLSSSNVNRESVA